MIKTHSVDVELAKKVGFDEANILGFVAYWVKNNRDNNRNFYDGRYWTYNSAQALTEQFPYWTRRQISGLLEKLEKMGAIIKGNYNKNKFDRSSWYALSDKFMYLIGAEMDETNTEIHFTNTEMDETNTEIIIGNNYKPIDKPNSFSAREKNQTSLTTKSENKNFDRPLNENQVGYGVEKPNPISKPKLEAKPSLDARKSNNDYVSYTSPKNYATEKEWYAALKMTDLMGWNIEGILYTHLIPYLEDKRGRPLQDFEIKRISAELAKYVGVSQLEIVRRCIKGGFREIKPFGTDKLRKDYPDMCWELGDNYEI
ncbi:hypothetical protein [Campylobacter showae]|uniref:hypothetical protein n=1 Tax=Campylobacter showae TaxID=204 RepID=UPI0028D82A26|nr:hypothetical protein [Campylobacter showae]